MDVMEIDGSFGEGGGQILRSAVSLACIKGQPIQIRNIRNNRKSPGLRAQHLTMLKILAKVCDARVEGLQVGSTSVTFVPNLVRTMSLSEDVGTAGSISLILQALVPAVALSDKRLHLTVTGGTDVPWSPTLNYVRYVLSEAYARIGIIFSMNIRRRGYYPRGGGVVDLVIEPCARPTPIRLLKRDTKSARLVCSCTDMDGQISSSVDGARRVLEESGFAVQTEKTEEPAASTGASLLISSSDSDSICGADDLLDAKNKRSFGKKSVQAFLDSGLGVDLNLSDMLVTPLSVCDGTSVFTVKQISKHLETNLYITSKITGCKYGIGKIDGGYEVRIQGVSDPRIQ